MRSLSRTIIMLSALSLAAVACGDDSEDEEEEEGEEGLPDVECSGDIPTYEEVAAFDKCTMCHSSELEGEDRMGAPDDDNWDDEEEATEHAEEIAHEVFEGEMPPEESGIELTNSEKEDLYLWALCAPGD